MLDNKDEEEILRLECAKSLIFLGKYYIKCFFDTFEVDLCVL
jgi:hypothetical protein